MIDKPLDQIEYSDIDSFVQAQWPEGKTVEYKRDTYGSSDADKKELLKDVSSLANTQGGDIYIGIDEDKGIPVSSGVAHGTHSTRLSNFRGLTRLAYLPE